MLLTLAEGMLAAPLMPSFPGEPSMCIGLQDMGNNPPGGDIVTYSRIKAKMISVMRNMTRPSGRAILPRLYGFHRLLRRETRAVLFLVVVLAGLAWGFYLGHRKPHVLTEFASPLAPAETVAPVPGAPPPASPAASESLARPLPPAAPTEKESPAAPSPGAGEREGPGAQKTEIQKEEDPMSPVGGEITCTYGWIRHPVYEDWRFHPGIDIKAPSGTPVKAALSGTVVQAGKVGSYGLAVTIDHGNGKSTFYGHLDSIAVKAGDQVRQGAIIGRCGETGVTTGPHVHFEARKNGEPVAPNIR